MACLNHDEGHDFLGKNPLGSAVSAVEAKAAEGVPEGGLAKAQAAATAAASEAAKLGLSPDARRFLGFT